jgi:exonuclease SbcC
LVATYSGWLAGLESAGLEAFSVADLDETVDAYRKAADARRSAARELLAARKSEYKTFSDLRDQSANLAQELRQIAARMLKNSSKPDECPLCHAQFQPGELARHMTAGVDEHLENVGQAILDQIASQEAVVRNATADAITIDWLVAFSKRANLPAGSRVRSAVSRLDEVRRNLAQAKERLERLSRELLSLEQQGLSVARCEHVFVGLKEEGIALPEISSSALDDSLRGLAERAQSVTKMVEDKRAEEVEVKEALVGVLGTSEASVKQFRTVLARVKERVATTESMLAKLRVFGSSFVWPQSNSVAELAVEAESVRKVAVELQSVLGREKLAYTTRAESTKRRNSLAFEQGQLRQRINRLTQAQSVLADLQQKHSLDKAMNAALQQNQAAVESIFMRIHAPAEFLRLGSTWTTLIRRNGERETKLTEISTGQRAAFALSIFLAQNAQLTVAPPVVLIDDPIAHVDDLNSLSFLDYLREVTLTGRRQVYFATANEKVATLFERKFDFLGPDEFKRIDLRRTA